MKVRYASRNISHRSFSQASAYSGSEWFPGRALAGQRNSVGLGLFCYSSGSETMPKQASEPAYGIYPRDGYQIVKSQPITSSVNSQAVGP